MSYILEALKKAEQQRELGRVPGIGSVHEQTRAGARARWLWLLSGVLVLNGAVLLALFWADQRREPAVDAALASPAPRQSTPARQPVPAERAQPSLVAQDASRAPAAGVAMVPQTPFPTQDEPLRSGPAERSPARTDKRIPVASQQPAAQPDPPAQLPVWPQIPANLLAQLGAGLRLDVHVFASQPGERFVLINLKKYHQGQQLQEGPRLDEITSDGVILSFRGERFRLLAQR